MRRQVYNIGLDEGKRSNIDIDLEVHSLKDFTQKEWNETNKWDFSNSIIVFDPQGETSKVFSEKLKLPSDFWTKRIVICAKYLNWYCCPRRKKVGTVAEAWIKRGDMMAAHYCFKLCCRIVA